MEKEAAQFARAHVWGTRGILPAPAWHANKDKIRVKRKKKMWLILQA